MWQHTMFFLNKNMGNYDKYKNIYNLQGSSHLLIQKSVSVY